MGRNVRNLSVVCPSVPNRDRRAWDLEIETPTGLAKTGGTGLSGLDRCCEEFRKGRSAAALAITEVGGRASARLLLPKRGKSMKVRLLTSRVENGQPQIPGSEITVSDADGKRMCEMGQAAPVKTSKRKDSKAGKGRDTR